MSAIVNVDAAFSQHVLHPSETYPNNLMFPVLYYKQALNLGDNSEDEVKELLEQNGWTDAWSGGIFNHHHFHSTAHEVLVVTKGTCMLEMGGPDGNIQNVCKGDVIVLPAGVVHKNVGDSEDFCVVGAYPKGQHYDMNQCAADALDKAGVAISKVPIPERDPIYGNSGPLMEVWQKKNTDSVNRERQF